MESLREGIGAAPVATAVAVTVVSYGVWWRWSESRRVRNFVRGSSSGVNSSILPSPMPALPRWCGFAGGHTLLMKTGKVRFSRPLVLLALVPVVLRGLASLCGKFADELARNISSGSVPISPNGTKERVAMFEGWAEEFGGDYELHLVGIRAIVVTGLADIRRILALRPTKFKRGLRANLLTRASQEIGVKDSMFFEEGKAWGRSRRLISPNLSGHSIATMLPVVAKIGERFCARIGDRADHGEVMKARDSFARFTHDVIAMVAFGLDVGSITATPDSPCNSFNAIEVKTSAFGRLVRKRLDIWAWKYLPMVPWVRNTKEHSRRLENVIQGAIDAVRLEPKVPGAAAEGNFGAGGTLLRKIIGATSGSSDRMLFSDREVMHEATSLFVAGTETTALSLCWAMYYLSKNPEAVLRCRAEALETAPLSDGMVSTSEQLSKLEFCSAVFKEALRLRTPAPLLMFHSMEDYTMKNGFVVEEGNGVIVLTRAAGVSEEFFTRGKEFVPERWIEAEREEALLGKTAAENNNTVAHEAEAFMALGSGPRLCPGQDMAKAEGAIIIAAICARFDISMGPGQADPPEEISSFTNGPKEFDVVFSRKNV